MKNKLYILLIFIPYLLPLSILFLKQNIFISYYILLSLLFYILLSYYIYIVLISNNTKKDFILNLSLLYISNIFLNLSLIYYNSFTSTFIFTICQLLITLKLYINNKT